MDKDHINDSGEVSLIRTFLNNAINTLNLDRPDIAKLRSGQVIECNISSQRFIGYCIKQALAALTTPATVPPNLVDDVKEYLHWRKVNPQIKGGENYLARFRESLATVPPQQGDVDKELVEYRGTYKHHSAEWFIVEQCRQIVHEATTVPDAAPSPDACRAEFEKWAKNKRYLPLQRFSHGGYREMETNSQWNLWKDAWQARGEYEAARTPTPPLTPEQEKFNPSVWLATIYTLVSKATNAAFQHGWARGRAECGFKVPATRMNQLAENSAEATSTLKEMLKAAIERMGGMA